MERFLFISENNKKEPIGPLDEFKYKKHKEGTINKHAEICTHAGRLFDFTKALQVLSAISAKHIRVKASSSGARPG